MATVTPEVIIRIKYGWLYENSFDPDKSLTMIGVSLGYGKRLNWPDNWFQFYASLNYTRYVLKNWTPRTFDDFHNGSANDLNLELRLTRNSIDNPIFTRRGSEFMVSVSATPPYSLFDKKDYSNPNLTDGERYNLIEYVKWKYSGKIFVPLANPATVTRTPVMMARVEGGIITSYDKYKRSPFGRYYMGGDMMAGYTGSYTSETIGLRGYKNGSIAGVNYNYANSYMKMSMELRYPLLFQGQTNIWLWLLSKPVMPGSIWMTIIRSISDVLPGSVCVSHCLWWAWWVSTGRMDSTDPIRLAKGVEAISTLYWDGISKRKTSSVQG